MYVEKNQGFDIDRGMVSVNIKNTGYAHQGAFSLNITDGISVVKIGEGKFGDNVPDLFLVPVPTQELNNKVLIILGNYVPSYGHSQISVDYEFYQQGKKIDSEPIRYNGTSLIAHHDFTFKKNSEV